ncbi:hypothetical protein SCAR479_12569 [Seiridium cardinale]|uniref:Uncharacterized protein n=1 Tax=Seiridium cardinale TaxID=138064 RepID=A0ABR2XAF0_9PEZI
MKFLVIALVASLHISTSLCAPVASQRIADRSLQNSLEQRQNKGTKSGGKGGAQSANAVQQAADNFAGDVATVSNSLNTLGTTTDQATRKQLANAGFKAESDEDAQRSVLFAAGNNEDANTKIVDNTPIVLDGLTSIAKDPSDANTAKQLQTMETARNANILPSITALTNSAFKASGIDSTAQKFQSTTGSQSIKATVASEGGGNTSSPKSGGTTCTNCVRKGRACPGYQVSLSWSTKHEQLSCRTPPQTSGPADFELLASTASQAIHRGTQRETPTTGRTPDTAPAINYDAVPGLEECGQAGAGLRSSPIPSYDYGAQTCPEAIVSLTGYHSPGLPTRTPMIIDATPATPTSCCPVDTNRRTTSSVTDSGWVDEDHYTPTMTSPGMSSPTVSSSSEVSLDQFMMLGSPAAGLVDYPTFLVQHWFSSVCCYWSAFDSESNPFRSVAASLWGSSGIVFYSLQSMSAAALVEFMPDMKGIASSAPLLAVEAISEELTELYTAEPGVLQFPKGLMLGLFCMGSSMCWDDPQKTGALFFRQARRLLRHFQLRSESLSEEDRQLLEFFRGCMKYEEMLRHVAGEREAIVPQRASQSENCKRQLSMKPHAWTGVSPDLLGLFGDVISLCRRECARRQGQTITRESLSQALDAIDAAQALEEALLVEPTVIQPDDQQPDDTRWVHLRDTTESYRIASLLQLYQTFPDLVARRIPKKIGPDGLVPDSIWLMPLALHLTTILERIPPSSDLRCIQPLLYLSAGSCLRYNEDISSSIRIGSLPGDITSLLAIGAQESLPYRSSPISPVQSRLSTSDAFGVSCARKLVMERLGQLEQVLPPKPIRVAQQLMKATWEAFDSEVDMPRKTHWLDVMASTGLKTLFG